MSSVPLLLDSSPPHVVPVKFRRKSSSASERAVSDVAHYHLCSSSPLSSIPPCSPPSTMGQLARHPIATVYGEGHPEKNAAWARKCDAEDMDHHWSRSTKRINPHDHSPHRPLPSLMSRFSSYSPCEDDVWSSHPLDSFPRMSSDLFSEGDSAVDDQDEECDLESMDIHARGSYFQVSEERGRWRSSPITPRKRIHMFASSPVRACFTNGTSPIHPRTRRQSVGSIACSEASIPSFPEERADSRSSSPLPSSSPPTSPMSLAPSLPEEYIVEGDKLVDSTPLLPERPLSRDVCGHLESPLRCANATPSSCSVSIGSNEDSLERLSPSGDNPHPNTSTHLSTEPTLSEEGISAVPVNNLSTVILSPHWDPSTAPNPPCKESGLEPASLSLPAIETTAPAPRTKSPPVKNILQPSKVNQETTQAILAEADSSVPKIRNAAAPVTTRSQKKKLSTARTKRNEGQPSVRPRKRRRLSVKEDSKGPQSCKHSGGAGTQVSSRRGRSPHRATVEEHPPCASSHDELRVPSPAPLPCTQLAPDVASIAAPPVQECSAAEHAELTGLLVEALATSRATSMDTAALCLVLTQTHPRLAARYDKRELVRLIRGALEAGRVRCGMFERVRASGEGVADGLEGPMVEGEGRWFYVAVRDVDRERASLVSALMPRQKRSETMKYKQYYWRPLDRISKWDPEDAL